MLRLLLLALALMAPGSLAYAKCNPAVKTGVPFNCDAGNTPAPADLFLGGSNTGATAGQTVAFTGGQVVAMDHTNSPVTPTGSATSKTLGVWIAQLLAGNVTPIIIGGQSIVPGGATINQGNGSKLALASGTFVSGHCRQTDSNGNEVDSGAACGSGGTGSGTVTNATAANGLAYYAATGTTVSALTTGNNGILVTSAGGVPSIATTAPSGITYPAANLSNANLTGIATVATANAQHVNAQASTTAGASVNIAQGVAPTTPANGDVWMTTSGLSYRAGGTTISPNGTVTSVSGTAPLSGTVSTSGSLSCPTCATTISGGALTATSPMAISSSGVISIGVVPGAAIVQWPSSVTVTADTYYITLSWPWTSGTITGVSYATGGTATPSFSIAVQIAGSSVTGCSGITVSSATVASATCTAANTITSGQKVTLAVSAVSGTPNAAQVQIKYTRSAN